MATEPTPGQPQDGSPPSGPNGWSGQPSPHVPAPRAPSQVGGLPLALSTPPNALSLLKALRRRWVPAAGVGLLLAAALGAGTWFLMPPSKHFVRTLILMPRPTAVVAGFGPRQVPGLYDHQRTQVALVRSRLVLNAALRDPEVARLSMVAGHLDPVEWLEGQVVADFSHAPEVLRIGMYGDKPEELVVLVNALCKAYLSEIVERETKQRQGKLETLRGLHARYVKQLKEGRNAQAALEQLGAPPGDPVARALVLNYYHGELRGLDAELYQTNSKLLLAKVELDFLQKKAKQPNMTTVPDAVIEAAVGKSPEVQKQNQIIQALQKLINNNLKLAPDGENDPHIKKQRAELAKAQAALEDLKKELRPAIKQAWLEAAAGNLGGRISELESQIVILTESRKLMADEQKSTRKEIQDKMKNGAKIDDIKEDLGHFDMLIKNIATEELSLNLANDAPKNEKVIEEAVVYHARSTAGRQAMMAAGAALAGLVLAALAFAYWEFRARRVDTVDEVALGLGLRVVGALPDASRPTRRLWSHGADAEAYGHALLTESIDATRTLLLHAARQGSIQVVMVTSAMPGEGKTSLACHLAASLARSGLKTLLIDGDLRNPTAHRLFELSNGAGLCALLRGEARPAEVVRPTAVSGLTFLSAGQWDCLAAQGLAQNRTKVILGQLRRDYDFILIDSSPVLAVTDALLLGQSVDAAVLSVLRDVSRLPNVYTAGQRLAAVGVHVLGAVVNGVPGESYSAPYKYVGGARSAPEANAPEGST